ncbi:uncharacterized protein EDB91DRAFT_1244296 [Suillus paluster]|uniref:uncharacterized protein n=1 Tax=Suillus paluster TaxID=48578 RepID=UPI001B8724CD|nr:uncharacterized protein EDB91DRAFT_1244296 [Suillus paluster]KAG1749681.1 hypothetical protein EDB91DRAFT_1244296 [Suillus paluster]
MDLNPNFHYNSRRKVAIQIFSGTGTNHTTTIIIVVLCAVVGMLILYGLFRFLRHRFARRSTPLPPVQPIAHYRKQRLTEFTERPDMSTTYSQSSRLSPSFELSPAASDSSLLPAKYDNTFPSRQSSLYLAEKGDGQGVPPPPGKDEEVLQTPNPAFNYARRLSSSSLGSTPSTPPSASVAHRSPSQATLPRSYSRRTGPPSAVSSASIRSTKSSGRSTIIGVPHGPHSQVKVVLPAPLAPSLHPYLSGPEAGRLGVDTQTSSRTTMVDMWASPLHRSVSSDYIRPNPPALSAVHQRGASPSNARQRTSSYTPSSSYHSSAIGSPAIPPMPTQNSTEEQLNGAPYAVQHQQDDSTRDRRRSLSRSSPPLSEGSTQSLAHAI